MRILHPASPADDVLSRGGSKAAGLRGLADLGLPVPEWRVIPVDAFTDHLARHGIAETAAEALAHLGPEQVTECAQRLGDLVRHADPDDELREAVQRVERDLGPGPFAVRSSAEEEDGDRTSFAGQFTTVLNVSGTEALVRAVLECWASVFSARSLSYRLQHGLRAGGMAVVVQRLVSAEVSGVLFTANPMTGSRCERVISAVWGLGEGLVSGAVDADTVVVDHTGAVRSTTLGDKAERYTPSAGGGVTALPVDAEDSGRACVDPQLRQRLCAIADTAEERFGTPQDIEWAWSDGRVWVLQSRPITSPLAPPAGRPRTWDNSNIIESFRGVTSPLTYSFARRVYGEVYRHHAKSLGLTRRELDQVERWTPHLLGYFNGHVYYNLHNWYRLVGLAPFYRNGRRSLELTLGVRESLPDQLAESLTPHEHAGPVRRRLSTARTRTAFAWRILRRDATVRRFLRGFQESFDGYDRVDYTELSGDEVVRRYLALERDFVRRWGRVSITDPAISLFFGFLSHLTLRWLPAAPQWLAWAVAGPGKVVSVEPAERMAELADRVHADPDLEALLRATPPERARQALADAGHHRFLAEVDRYIARFGYRSVDELKLEVPELSHDPASFFSLLGTALGGRAPRPAADVETHLEGLTWPRRAVYRWARSRARRAFAAREQTRFCRTMAFGVVKRMFRAIGADLARSGHLTEPSEVYLLTVEEVVGVYEGTLVDADLTDLVRRRRAALATPARAPERFATVGAAYTGAGVRQWADDDEVQAGAGDELVGVAAGPGRASGPAAVVETPHGVDGHVVVTYRTDPGWVAVLPSAAALLIERGSPLTHVAIVARELGVPTVVQIKDLTRRVSSGMQLDVDGSAGRVRLVGAEHG